MFPHLYVFQAAIKANAWWP